MAGLIAGTGESGGGRGAFGLAPGTKILPIRMPKAETAANEAEARKRFNQTLALAIRYAADEGAQVVNISLAQPESDQRVTEAVKFALDKGSLVFAGVGNDGDEANEVMYPAATPGVVGVAAVGKNLRRTAESEYGPQVDMAAPGADLLYACGSATGLCQGHGTSGAAALASASAALIWSKHPDWTNNQVLRVMLNTIGAPTDGAKRNDSIGYGIVRPRIALQNPGDPGPADVYPLPDFAAAVSQSRSPSVPASEGAEQNAPQAAASTASQDDKTVWIALGAAAVVLLGATIAILVVRGKRRRQQHAEPFTPPYAHAQHAHGGQLSTPPQWGPGRRG
ncbi:S8 family serine peptidase [Streptomyces gossypiisoli]|uniref:S8 family serine peptidase n=1 Tax=Streptomyces gossypiisoli TaxID=2748864 RepID=UPI001E2D9F6A|nr:S8 family serine peptidase [Streptomyces gossypiisoli]